MWQRDRRLPDALGEVVKADLALQNLSARIPQEKLASLVLKGLAANPYNPAYYDFAEAVLEAPDELRELRGYFKPSALKNAVMHDDPTLVDLGAIG